MYEGKMTGIYIHIPFCLKKCRYCDFYSLTDTTRLPAFLAALDNQLKSSSAAGVDSIYIGGGTPSLLSGFQMAELAGSLRRIFNPAKDCEFTIEVNPASCDFETLQAYRRAGVNRLSVGVQTFSDTTLSILGRLHSSADARRTFQHAKSAGFTNISADLMLALPGEDEDSIMSSIDELADLGVSHISAYLLKLSEDTPLGKTLPDSLPDDDRASGLYRRAAAYLTHKGYNQYEISNFAEPGFKSRHNLKYWNCDDYIGFGPAAHSSVSGKRYSFARDTKAYIDMFNEPVDDFLLGQHDEGRVDWEDYLMLKLRTNEGLSLSSMKRRFLFSFSDKMKNRLSQYEKAGLLKLDGDCLRLTLDGMLVSNSIISGLLAAADNT